MANREWIMIAGPYGLVLKTAGLADLLRAALDPLAERIHLAFVYGSLASGKADAASDVDVVVIGAVSLSELVEALGPLQNRIGREVNPAVHPVAEFRKKVSQGHRILSSVIAGPKLFLIGRQNELELARDRCVSENDCCALPPDLNVDGETCRL